MPNYMGVLSDMDKKLKTARSVLDGGSLQSYMDYYRQELHRSDMLKDVTLEVNEACEIAFNEMLHEVNCLVSCKEHEDYISFDFTSERMGQLGTIEIPNEEDFYAKLLIKREKVAELLQQKTIEDLEKYTKHLQKIEELLKGYVEVQFV